MILLNRYFAKHYLNDAFKEVIGSLVLAQLTPDIELQPDLSFSDILYMHRGFTNLLSNVCGLEGFEHWTRNDEGNGWIIENWPEFRGNKSAFISSYGWCSLSQTIDLLQRGYTEREASNSVVVAGAVMCARFDCGSEGAVDLGITPGKHGEMTTGEIRCPMEGLVGSAFRPITISIVEKLPSDGRVVAYTVRGKDTRFWAGQYGARILHTFLYVIPIPVGKRAEDVIKTKGGAK